MPVREYHVLSLGAGVQSTTLFLMMRSGEVKVPPETQAVFADTQEEPQAVYEHLNYLMALEWPSILCRTKGKLGDDLIHGRNTTGGRFVTIPAFTTDESDASHGQGRRQCTLEYKVNVIETTIRREVIGLPKGRPVPRDTIVHQYFGISRDEARRSLGVKANVESKANWFAHFPLLEMDLTRADCLRWLKSRVPHPVPRSACVFCPFKSDREWLELKRNNPQGWMRAVEVDQALRSTTVLHRRTRQAFYLHAARKPLEEVNLNEGQGELGFQRECQGMCGV